MTPRGSTTRATCSSTPPSTTTRRSTSCSGSAALVLEESFALRAPVRGPAGGSRLPGRVGRPRPAADAGPRTQVPHLVRTTVAALLRLPEHRLRVIAPDVGGGFGQKCVVAREEALTCIAARRLGAPVKWVEDRQESLAAGFQGHEQRFHIRAGFDDEGRLLGLAADILCDVGAYFDPPVHLRGRAADGGHRAAGALRGAAIGRGRARWPRTSPRWRPTAACRARRWCSRWSG